jgi:uncharacterized protein (TIGR02996 family)
MKRIRKRGGRIVGAEIAVDEDAPLAEIIGEILGRPAASGIEDLEVTVMEGFDELLPLVMGAPSLRSVTLQGGHEYGDGCTLSLLNGHPGLRRLEVAPAILVEDTPLRLPALEELVLDAAVITDDAIRNLALAELPALRRLELHLRRSEDGIEAGLADLEVLFAATFPSLRELVLCEASWDDEHLAKLIIDAPLVKTLEVLEIPDGRSGLRERLDGKLGACRLKTDEVSTEDKPSDAAIIRDPEDAAPYLVLSDWLEEQGDPHGELIRVQHALAAKPTAALRKRERELLRKHTFLEGIPADDVGLALTWHLGHVRAARLYVSRDYDWVLPTLLEKPVGRYVRELTVKTIERDQTANVLEHAIRDIARVEPPCLRKLTLETQAKHVITLKDLVAKIPTLETLTVPFSVKVKGKVKGCTVIQA